MSARDEGGAYARMRENLSELGLDAMAAGLPHWMSAVAAGEADFASAMLAMTSEEAEAKRRRGTDRKVRAAGFPFVKTLADFDFSFQPSIPRAVVDDLATLRFLDAAENVVLVGSPGWARPTSRWRWGWRRCAPARRCASPTARRWCAT